MYVVPSEALEIKRRTASKFIPGWAPGLLGALQVVLWIAIMVLEGVIVYYNASQGTIFAGFWCSGIFFITWVSMFCFLCCGKSNCCGIFLILMNSIALCFSIILVTFTFIFVNNPCKCYGPFCQAVAWITCRPLSMRKLPYLKGLLACAVLMALSNLAYIVTHISVSIWLRNKANADIKQMNATYQKQSASVDFGHQQRQIPTSMNYPSHIGERPYSVYPMNDGYRQPSPKKPMPQWQPSQYVDEDDGRF